MIKKIGIVSAVILCLLVVIAGLYYFSIQKEDKNLNNHDREAMINIALNDDVFKWYLNNLTYNVTRVDSTFDYILFDVGNSSSYWESVMVGVDLVNNKTTYVYLIGTGNKDLDVVAKMANTALLNGTVKSYINGQKYDINDANTSSQQVIFDVGNMTDTWGHLLVGVDLANNKTTYVTYLPQTPFMVPSGNTSIYLGAVVELCSKFMGI